VGGLTAHFRFDRKVKKERGGGWKDIPLSAIINRPVRGGLGLGVVRLRLQIFEVYIVRGKHKGKPKE